MPSQYLHPFHWFRNNQWSAKQWACFQEHLCLYSHCSNESYKKWKAYMKEVNGCIQVHLYSTWQMLPGVEPAMPAFSFVRLSISVHWKNSNIEIFFKVAELVMDIRLDLEQAPSHLHCGPVCQLLGKDPKCNSRSGWQSHKWEHPDF